MIPSKYPPRKSRLFPLGTIVGTPGALAACEEHHVSPNVLILARHARGDWGDVDAEDAAANEAAIRDGSRILSAYTINHDHGVRLWVITEADRSVTTILLPEEY